VNSLVSIITPTWRANPDKLRRCLTSVKRQTYGTFEHIVASDGGEEIGTHTIVDEFDDLRIRYWTTRTHHGGYGAAVRQEVMCEAAAGDYLVFLDDDNIIFPRYLECLQKALQASPEARFAICGILHFGPLQAFHGPPPVVLPGKPELYHIDTLQIMVETEAMREVGWASNSYFADGETYSELARCYSYVNVPECLCAHL
jgi:glycosyltransferase involved in cell wall biosynthesis